MHTTLPPLFTLTLLFLFTVSFVSTHACMHVCACVCACMYVLWNLSSAYERKMWKRDICLSLVCFTKWTNLYQNIQHKINIQNMTKKSKWQEKSSSPVSEWTNEVASDETMKCSVQWPFAVQRYLHICGYPVSYRTHSWWISLGVCEQMSG